MRPGGIQSLRDNKVLDAGVIRPKKDLSHSDRLGQIHEAIYKICVEHKPQVCVIEKGFTGINHNSALRLGETRGAIIAAARRSNIEIIESAPTEVKKLVTGQGHASKENVSAALQSLIGFNRGSLPYDVTDAVAIALSYCMGEGLERKLRDRNLNGRPPRARHNPQARI